MNKLFILKQVDLIVIKTSENHVLKLQDLFSTFGNGSKLLVLLSLKLGLLRTHHNTEALFFKTGFNDNKVNDVNLSADLRGVVRVWQSSSDVKLELGIVLNLISSEFDCKSTTMLNQ